MKHMSKIMAASILSVLMASTAFAAPQHEQHGQQQQQKSQQQPQQQKKSDDKKQNGQTHQSQNNHQSAQQKSKSQQSKKVAPSRDWKVGGKVPTTYRSNNYKVGHDAHNLPKPGKNQRWIKVNGDYVLENIVTHAIIKIITGR
ncbi:hypothetical protein GCM10023206_22250 [Acinetobacter puyangensis]|uniref:Regulator RcnB of Ni and Co efflux n=1 Tax=Acinetobacter puyangensis TaxID=1096779 RepID=A0A240ECS8_9GAMM|nr:RcnB family protein [Acinetobacter puyangensis]SNX45969.1 regulator RcnB of Ni and Co efflux [Acinetobacter puyangensis]